MAQRPKLQQITSPRGIAMFPWLNKPDTKFKAEGTYKITLRLPPSEKRDALVATLEKAMEAGYKEKVAELSKDPKNKGKKVKRSEDLQWGFVQDDDGNDTEDMDFKFKMTASGVKQDGTPWTMKPRVFGPDNKPFNMNQAIWGGSEVSVAFEIFPWYTPKFGFGIQLRLNAVKVYKVVDGSGGNAERYGFEDAEDEEVGSSDEATGGSDETAGADPAGDEF